MAEFVKCTNPGCWFLQGRPIIHRGGQPMMEPPIGPHCHPVPAPQNRRRFYPISPDREDYPFTSSNPFWEGE